MFTLYRVFRGEGFRYKEFLLYYENMYKNIRYRVTVILIFHIYLIHNINKRRASFFGFNLINSTKC